VEFERQRDRAPLDGVRARAGVMTFGTTSDMM
jgi:hypothetical protein